MDIGQELRQLRTQHRLSLRALGARAYVSHVHITDIENGRKRPSRELAEQLDRVLDAGGRLVKLAAPEVDAERLDPAIPWPRETGSAETLRGEVADLVRLDTRHGSDAILPLALRVFGNARAKLATVSGHDGPRFAEATGQAGQVAGWVAYDADRQDLARRLLSESLVLARAAGDRSTEVFDLALVAMVDLYQQRPVAALRIAEDMGGAVTGRVGALFGCRRARALAQLGREKEAAAALDRAKADAEHGATSDPPWTWWIDESEITGHWAVCLTDLGKWSDALPGFRAALHLRGRDRTRAHYNDAAYLFEALVMAQEWEEAEHLTPELLEYVRLVESRRTTRILRRATDQIGRSRAGSTLAGAAHELRELA